MWTVKLIISINTAAMNKQKQYLRFSNCNAIEAGEEWRQRLPGMMPRPDTLHSLFQLQLTTQIVESYRSLYSSYLQLTNSRFGKNHADSHFKKCLRKKSSITITENILSKEARQTGGR